MKKQIKKTQVSVNNNSGFRKLAKSIEDLTSAFEGLNGLESRGKDLTGDLYICGINITDIILVAIEAKISGNKVRDIKRAIKAEILNQRKELGLDKKPDWFLCDK